MRGLSRLDPFPIANRFPFPAGFPWVPPAGSSRRLVPSVVYPSHLSFIPVGSDPRWSIPLVNRSGGTCGGNLWEPRGTLRGRERIRS